MNETKYHAEGFVVFFNEDHLVNEYGGSFSIDYTDDEDLSRQIAQSLFDQNATFGNKLGRDLGHQTCFLMRTAPVSGVEYAHFENLISKFYNKLLANAQN